MSDQTNKLPVPIRTAPKPQSLNTASFVTGANVIHLPEIDHAGALVSNTLTQPDEIIAGILHSGTKGVFASGSKIGKTWILLDLATAVATGTPWLKFKTQQKKVLFINFEIRREFIAERLKTIQQRKKLTDLTNLDIWNLRGQTAEFESLVDAIIKQASAAKYSLIILDPIYKAMVGKSENTASSVGEMCNQIERIVEASGAAIVFAHHFTKGNVAKKNQIDRMSGSGVFARDADTIITLTEHQEKNCYSAEFTLRNLAPQSPFVIEWQYPVMVERPDLSPTDFKAAEQDQDEYEPLLNLLDATPLTTSDWLDAALVGGYSRASFFRDKGVLVEQRRVQVSEEKLWSRTNNETNETTVSK